MNKKTIKTGCSKIEVRNEKNGEWEPFPDLIKPIIILFRDIPPGAKFIVNGIIHKKISSSTTYGYSIENIKKKRGRYFFHPETKLLINKNK